MSRILQRQHLKFQTGAALKTATSYSALLGPALQGTTNTMPSLGATAPTTWKSGLSSPTEAKLDALWNAVAKLRELVTGYNLHAHPTNLSATITANASAFTENVTVSTFLRPGYDELQKRSLQLTRGTRLLNQAGNEVLGGTAMDGTENGDPLTADVDDYYPAEDFTGLLGDATAEAYATQLSLTVNNALKALATNQLLQTA
jgi:hypothetical protein